MALSAAQINNIKRYLGYDLVTPDAWKADAATGLDYNIERLDADAETTITGLLTELSTIDTQIAAAYGRLKAEQVGDLRLNARRELSALRSERNYKAAELARLLGVPVANAAVLRFIV